MLLFILLNLINKSWAVLYLLDISIIVWLKSFHIFKSVLDWLYSLSKFCFWVYISSKLALKLDNEVYDVGYIKDTRIVPTKAIPVQMQEKIKTANAYRIDYIVNLV